MQPTAVGGAGVWASSTVRDGRGTHRRPSRAEVPEPGRKLLR